MAINLIVIENHKLISVQSVNTLGMLSYKFVLHSMCVCVCVCVCCVCVCVCVDSGQSLRRGHVSGTDYMQFWCTWATPVTPAITFATSEIPTKSGIV